MVWSALWHDFSTLLGWIRIGRLSELEKNLEILLQRRQPAAVDRTRGAPFRRRKVLGGLISDYYRSAA